MNTVFLHKIPTQFPNPKPVSNWIMGSLLGLLNTLGKPITESPISPDNLAQLLKLIDDNIISGKIAKAVFDEMAQTGRAPKEIVKEKGLVQVTDESATPKEIVKEKGLVQVTDESAIKAVVEKVLEECSKEVENYKNGKTKLFGFFVGQVMKETKGKANPKIVNEILKDLLCKR